MSWFVQGDDPKRNEFIKTASSYRPMNFWMTEGQTKEIVFLDDKRFGCKEHNIKMGEKKFKPYTCGRDAGLVCEFCNDDKALGYSEYYSIIDLTPYKDKQGKDHKHSVKLLRTGKDVSGILELRRKEQAGSLLGCQFRVSRTGAKSPACGNDWAFVRKIDPGKFPPEYKPYDFLELLKPVSQAEARSIVNRSNGMSSGMPDTFSRSELESPPPFTDADAPPPTPAGAITSEDEIPF